MHVFHIVLCRATNRVRVRCVHVVCVGVCVCVPFGVDPVRFVVLPDLPQARALGPLDVVKRPSQARGMRASLTMHSTVTRLELQRKNKMRYESHTAPPQLPTRTRHNAHAGTHTRTRTHTKLTKRIHTHIKAHTFSLSDKHAHTRI